MFLLVGGNGAASSDILQCASVKFFSHAGKLTRPVKKVARLATFLTGLVSFQKTASHFLLKGAKSIKKRRLKSAWGLRPSPVLMEICVSKGCVPQGFFKVARCGSAPSALCHRHRRVAAAFPSVRCGAPVRGWPAFRSRSERPGRACVCFPMWRA